MWIEPDALKVGFTITGVVVVALVLIVMVPGLFPWRESDRSIARRK